MARQTFVDRMMSETVCYGGLLVSRGDMYRHLQDVGVKGPAGLVYSRLPALEYKVEWHYKPSPEGHWFNPDTGQVLD